MTEAGTDSETGTDKEWGGGDLQELSRTDGGVALCAGCRARRSCGLGVTTEELGADDVATFSLSCPATAEGGPGVAHGGWTAAVLDEVCGHVPLLHDQLSVTGTITVRYVRPVPIGRPLRARAWIEQRYPRKWSIAGEITLDSSGATLATATGIWVLREREAHFSGFQRWLAEQGQEGPSAP